MAAGQGLSALLASMEPVLLDGEYVFCSFPNARIADFVHLDPVASFQEKEGLSLIVDKEIALANDILFDHVYKLISLTIHSSLEAVGLTAAFSQKLASKGISANVVAAYFHDHIFIPEDRANDAVNALSELQKENRT